jgi:hypothetical protein
MRRHPRMLPQHGPAPDSDRNWSWDGRNCRGVGVWCLSCATSCGQEIVMLQLPDWTDLSWAGVIFVMPFSLASL